MKYTEKTPDFQRLTAQIALIALSVCSLTQSVHAQELAWPEPAAAPERFVGALVQLENYERFYDPFRSMTIYGADRRGSGTILAKLAWGQRGTIGGMQAEAEWYPVLSEGTYAYLGYALGLAAPFPRHRGGAEYFTAFPSAFEGSAGFRAYVFRDRRTVTLLTASAAKYAGNFWFSIRPYVSVNLPRTSVSVTATGRYYTGGRDEFLFIRAAAGFVPDERATFSTSGLPATEVFTLHSQTLGVGAQQFVSSGWLATIEGNIGRQEVGFQRGTYVWNPSVLIGVRCTMR